MLIVVFLCSSKGDSKVVEVLLDAFRLLSCLRELFAKRTAFEGFCSISFIGIGTELLWSLAIPEAEANKKQYPKNRIFLFIFLGSATKHTKV